MYLQEIETKSKKLGEFHSVKNWTGFLLTFITLHYYYYIYCPVKTNRLWTETV